MKNDLHRSPRGTSWGAIVLGFFTTLGVATLLSEMVTAILNRPDVDPTQTAAALPPLAALLVAAFCGGHVAGRIAGYRTSWHGLMTAMLGLFVVGAYMLAQLYASASTHLAEVFPSVMTFVSYRAPEPLALGVMLILPAQILGAWLGGLLAPTQPIATKQATTEPKTAPVVPQPPTPHLPSHPRHVRPLI